MAVTRLINEGGVFTETVGVPSGVDPALVFDLENVRIDYSGSARNGIDYTVGMNVLSSSVQLGIRALRDDEVEGIEEATISATGRLVTIMPGATGTRYENVLGDWVEGTLATETVNTSVTFRINSAPVGTLDPIVHIGGGSSAPVRSLLDAFADGPGEVLRIGNPGAFDLGHSAGRLEADGTLRLDRVDAGAPDSFDLSILVRDDNDAFVRATQRIEIARLTLENPDPTVILIEGDAAPAFRFALSRPVDVPITLTARIAPAGFGNDVVVMQGDIAAGATSADLALLRAVRDDVLEPVETGRVTLTARAGDRAVPINGADAHAFDLEVWDALRSPVTPRLAQQGYDTASKLNKALFDKLDIALAAGAGADHAAVAQLYARKVAGALSVAIDAYAISAAYDARMTAAERLAERDAQIDATYDARRLLVAETGSAVAKTLVTSAAGSFAGGVMAGLLGVSTVALWPVLATVGVGWGAVLLYEAFEEDIKRAFVEDFSTLVPRSTYRSYYEEVDRARMDNPDLSLRFGTDSTAPVALTDAREAVLLTAADARVAGPAAALDGDVVFGMGAGGSILVEGARFGADGLRVTRGSAVLAIDLDGDGADDAVLTLAGTFDGIGFGVVPDAAGTLITVDTAVEPLVLTGTPGPDTLTGGPGDDTLAGAAGDDVLRGAAGRDLLNGGEGADTLDGGDGDDWIHGGLSPADRRDVVYAGAGNDTVHGGAGNDEVSGGDGDDLIFGEVGADTLIGNAGDDTLSGGSLADRLFGGPGDDFLNGGFGSDRLNGGPGADAFFHLGIRDHGSDWVQDYDAAQGDRLVFGGAGVRDHFQVNIAETAGAGLAGVAEAFVIHRPSGLILWALVDGGAQASINLQIGGAVVDLMA
jgi:hypothetical protein